MKIGKPLVLVQVILACLLLCSPVLGAPASETTTAGVMDFQAGYLEYDRESQAAILKDEAYIEYRDLKLWADNIHSDIHRDQVFAQGKIEIWRGDEKYSGDILNYNYKTRRGRLTRLKTVRGVSLVDARQVELLPDRIEGHDVMTTTCTRNPPHYRILARKMVMIPGSRIVLKNVRFKVGERTLFRLPRYVINMKSGEAVDRLFVKPGYTAAKGFTFKSAYQFYGTDHFYGNVRFEPSQFEGTNSGANMIYRYDENHGGQLDFAHHESKLIDQSSNRLALNHVSRLPFADAHLALLVTDNTFGNLGTDSEMNVRARLTREFPGWRTELALERRVDLDGDDFLNDRIEFLHSTPRFTFAQTGSTQILGTGIGLTVDGSIAEIREETSLQTVQTNRGEVNLNLSLPPMGVGDFQDIFASVRQTEDFYGSGEVRHFFSFQANSQERYSDSFSSAFNYVYQDSLGDSSPFASFDTLPPKANLLTGFLRLGGLDHFTATLFQVTRDFENEQFLNASSNFVYHTPIGRRRSLSLGVTPFYDLSRDTRTLDSLRVGRVSANFRVADRDRWSHAVIANYDALLERMQSVANRSQFRIGDGLRFDVDSNLSRDTFGSGFDMTKLNIGIVKDLHDWEGRLSWNVVQKEVFFEFYLKFAADRRVGLGVDYRDSAELTPTFGPTVAGGLAP